MQGISKRFPGVQALDDVHFRIFNGEVMALLGENGAGKSTLMKILSGVYRKDQGTIIYQDAPLTVKSPRDSIQQGITIIHQELNLIPELSAGENIFLGREPCTISGRIDWKKLYHDAQIILQQLNMDIDPKQPVRHLSIGEQQMVEIARALSLNTQILIMDEPTDALTDTETESLFHVIRELRAEGKALVYISHRIKEIFQICDRATILRDGQFIAEKSVSELDEDQIIEMMVGRKLEDYIPYEPCPAGKLLFEAKGLTSSVVKDVDISVHKGEILGLAGLMGAGRTELALTIFGKYPVASGLMSLDETTLKIHNPSEAIRKGIAYVSEDRKQLGLFLNMTVKDNITLSILKQFETHLFKTSETMRNAIVDTYISDLSIKTPGRDQIVRNLSGGNQQKVSIASRLITKPKLLILDEPTRGVDVGAKKEIYKLINTFKKQGLGIILISSEISEILGLCDRIAIMHEGTIEKILSRKDATQERILRYAVGLKEQMTHDK